MLTARPAKVVLKSIGVLVPVPGPTMVSFWPILAFSVALSLSPLFVDAQTTDQCANLDTELVVPDLLGVLTAVGVIDQCLCINLIPS